LIFNVALMGLFLHFSTAKQQRLVLHGARGERLEVGQLTKIDGEGDSHFFGVQMKDSQGQVRFLDRIDDETSQYMAFDSTPESFFSLANNPNGTRIIASAGTTPGSVTYSQGSTDDPEITFTTVDREYLRFLPVKP
jgi:hypothetical protein